MIRRQHLPGRRWRDGVFGAAVTVPVFQQFPAWLLALIIQVKV